ncbi:MULTISPECIES: AAA family ATPase [Larkinella]|uniref:AAA family ATPase n=1 Tax=Larkinella humicola TaxID=2607654 RepID=A0A5N1JBB1_9BACT|nr:AAA family ATPase [Larkinella humicola]KAA9349033.1 AAA family ATPase [Larkinella humicola]
MTIYLIAGPPGIGKSTNARELIPEGVPIVDQDLAAYQYKKRGFTDYQDIASLTTHQKIRECLFNKEDFALELNLGFPSHYAYLKSIANFDRSNQVNLLLFFTDDLHLCINRAKARFLNGGHEVKTEVIEEMYVSTMPLFEENKSLFQQVRLVDVSYTEIIELTRESSILPDWVIKNNLQIYL